MKHLPLIRKIAAQRLGEDAPQRRALWRGDDAYSRATAQAKDSAELLQPACGIWKEHQAKLTDDRVEAGVCESQRLTVHRDGAKPLTGKPGLGRVEHRRCDVGADHEPRRPDQ